MSAGDIDDKVISPDKVSRLREEYPEFDEYLRLAWTLKPNRSFFIPYGAGISGSGLQVYISHDLQTVVSGVECENALVRHETTEWGLREFCDVGNDYAEDPSGHRMANGVEFQRAEQLIDRPNAIELYTGVIDPQILTAERTKIKGKPIPRDLALYPYDDDLMEELLKEMWSDVSVEEWCRYHPEDAFHANTNREA